MPPLLHLLPHTSSPGSPVLHKKHWSTMKEKDRNALETSPLPPRRRTFSGNSISSVSSARKSPRPRALSSDRLAELRQRLKTAVSIYGKHHANNATLYNQMGNIHFRAGDMSVAEKAYRQAILCDSTRADAFLNLGTVFWSTGQVREAIPVLQQAELSAMRKNDRLTMASVSHQLGLCHSLLNEFELAMKQMNQALQIRQQAKEGVLVGKTLDAMGKVCYMKGDYATSIENHEQAYQQLKQVGCDLLGVLQNLLNAFIGAGEKAKALNTLKKMASILRKELQVTYSPRTARSLELILEQKAQLHENVGEALLAARCRNEAAGLY